MLRRRFNSEDSEDSEKSHNSLDSDNDDGPPFCDECENSGHYTYFCPKICRNCYTIHIGETCHKINVCTECGKKGHREDNCWEKAKKTGLFCGSCCRKKMNPLHASCVKRGFSARDDHNKSKCFEKAKKDKNPLHRICTQRCYYCDQLGHMAHQCHKKARDIGRFCVSCFRNGSNPMHPKCILQCKYCRKQGHSIDLCRFIKK